MKVKYVKHYSNHTGRRFARFILVDADGNIRSTHDVCVRDRNNIFEMSRAEAKAQAEIHFGIRQRT